MGPAERGPKGARWTFVNDMCGHEKVTYWSAVDEYRCPCQHDSAQRAAVRAASNRARAKGGCEHGAVGRSVCRECRRLDAAAAREADRTNRYLVRELIRELQPIEGDGQNEA